MADPGTARLYFGRLGARHGLAPFERIACSRRSGWQISFVPEAIQRSAPLDDDHHRIGRTSRRGETTVHCRSSSCPWVRSPDTRDAPAFQFRRRGVRRPGGRGARRPVTPTPAARVHVPDRVLHMASRARPARSPTRFPATDPTTVRQWGFQPRAPASGRAGGIIVSAVSCHFRVRRQHGDPHPGKPWCGGRPGPPADLPPITGRDRPPDA